MPHNWTVWLCHHQFVRVALSPPIGPYGSVTTNRQLVRMALSPPIGPYGSLTTNWSIWLCHHQLVRMVMSLTIGPYGSATTNWPIWLFCHYPLTRMALPLSIDLHTCIYIWLCHYVLIWPSRLTGHSKTIIYLSISATTNRPVSLSACRPILVWREKKNRKQKWLLAYKKTNQNTQEVKNEPVLISTRQHNANFRQMLPSTKRQTEEKPQI